MIRVMRYLALLVVCLGMFSSAWAETVPARILIGTSEAPLAPTPVFDGAGVLAPLQVISMLGASYVDSGGVGNLIVTAAGGQSGTIETVDVNGARMVPMDKVVTLIGGEHSWNAAKRTLTLLAHLDSVEFDNDTLKINCSFPVHATAKAWNGKIMVDVANTKLASEAKEVYIGAAAVERARLGQFDSTTTRVVLDLSKPTGYKLETIGSAAQIVLKVGDGLTPTPTAAQPSAKQPSGRSFSVTSVSVQKVDEQSFNVAIVTSGKATATSALSVTPPEIRIDLPAGQLGDSCTVTGSHSLVEPELTKIASGVRLSLRLSRPMAYNVEVRDTETMVYVRPPDKSGGTLAGKVIVIDPGHGGKEGGAQAGGCREKNLNIQIAKDLAAALAKHGVTTILTRDTDSVMGLAARPEVAVNAGADFFISVHCNSNITPESATGIETYYHMQEASPKLLACAIHDGVCKFTGMCDRRARSDRSLYNTGLGVLRRLENTGIPGVLLECGYVNNTSDRAKLLDAGHRAKLAAGIVAGLKAYVEGTPIQ